MTSAAGRRRRGTRPTTERLSAAVRGCSPDVAKERIWRARCRRASSCNAWSMRTRQEGPGRCPDDGSRQHSRSGSRRTRVRMVDVPARRLAAFAVAILLVAACETVPLTGRHQLLLFPEGQELHMGATAYRDVLKKGKVSADPTLNDQVTRVGHRIAQATGRNDYQWEFKVLDDKQVNAFCLPGGKVAVYTGILPLTRDDAGLAAVLGHEVSHAIARHSGERLSQQLGVQLGLVGAQLALSGQDP